MIEGRYDDKRVSSEQAKEIMDGLEGAIRTGIKVVRPLKRDYEVTGEVDPFGLAFNQPVFRIYVFYHESWRFTKKELVRIVKKTTSEVEILLQHANLKLAAGEEVIIRFYKRTGHVSARISGAG